MELINSVLGFIKGNLAEVLQVIGGFAALAMFTPNSTDNKIVQAILDLVNFLGGNLGKAKNG